MSIPTTSRSIAVTPGEHGRVQRTEIPVPTPGPQDVVVRTIRTGVCGTDREIIDGLLGTPPEGFHELVIGHEVLGRVVAVGAEVDDVCPGDLVSAMVRRPDDCPACRAGQPDMCLEQHYRERGIVGAHGYMTEYWVEERPYVVPVPESLEHVGVLVEPLTVVEKAVRQADVIQERMAFWQAETAVVTGAGPIGILGTLLLRARGVDVTTVARTPAPNPAADIVVASGASYVSTREESLDAVAARLPNVDLILECSGSAAVAFAAMGMLGRNGVLVLLSLTGTDDTVDVPAGSLNNRLVGGNGVVVGSVNAGFEDFTNAVDHLGRFEHLWPGLLERMFTHRLPFEGDPSAIVAKGEGGIKTLVEFRIDAG